MNNNALVCLRRSLEQGICIRYNESKMIVKSLSIYLKIKRIMLKAVLQGSKAGVINLGSLKARKTQKVIKV